MSFTLIKARHTDKKLLAILFLLIAAQPVRAACTVSTPGLNFGEYDVFSPGHTDFTGSIDVSCDTSTSYSLKLSSGNGSVNDRYMVHNSAELHYNLFVDSSRTMLWGDGVSGDSTQSGTTASNQTHIVYGRIPSGQNVTVGNYQDAVIVTLEY